MGMTNQEAIEIIKTAIAEVEWEYPMDYAVAFDMAIKALEEREDMVPIHPVADWLASYAAPPGMLPTVAYKVENIVALWMRHLEKFKQEG